MFVPIHINKSILVPNMNYLKKKRTNMNLSFNLDTNIKKDPNYKTIIIHKSGLEWVNHPEYKLYYALNLLPLEDCIKLIDELKSKDTIRLFSCDELNARRYKKLLSLYNFYCDII